MSVNPPGGPQPFESIPVDTIEEKLYDFYLRSWSQKNKAADDEMDKLKELNNRLKLLNELMSPLGTLQAKMGDSNTNDALKKAIEADPNLLYQINLKMKEAGLKLFPKTEAGQSGPAYEYFGLVRFPALSGVPEAKMPADLLPHLSKWAVKEQMTLGTPPWNAKYRAVIENFMGPQPDNPQAVSNQVWEELAGKIFTPIVPSEIPMRPFNDFSFSSLPGDPGKKTLPGLLIGGKEVRVNPGGSQLSYQDLRDTCIDIGNCYRRGLDWEMDLRVTGGLNKTFDGPAIFKALQDVKAEISDISNKVQAKTVDVNSALQRASASLTAVVELINRLFSTLGKVLG
jgi:hypothetical protein